MASDLYERDYYAWTQQQAAALRARRGGGNTLDYDNLAEEVEGLGKSDRRACESYITRILEHLLKLQLLGGEDADHWRGEIAVFRTELERDLTPSLRVTLPTELCGLYKDARRRLMARYAALRAQDLVPEQCPYTWDDVLGRGSDWVPTMEGSADEQ
jgi:hypothetical protein